MAFVRYSSCGGNFKPRSLKFRRCRCLKHDCACYAVERTMFASLGPLIVFLLAPVARFACPDDKVTVLRVVSGSPSHDRHRSSYFVHDTLRRSQFVLFELPLYIRARAQASVKSVLPRYPRVYVIELKRKAQRIPCCPSIEAAKSRLLCLVFAERNDRVSSSVASGRPSGCADRCSRERKSDARCRRSDLLEYSLGNIVKESSGAIYSRQSTLPRNLRKPLG